jgi:hypothetical protein
LFSSKPRLHTKGLEAAQLESQRAALESARQQQQQLHAAYSQLRDSFLAVHTALSPHNLEVAFGFKGGALGRLGLGVDAYEALTARVLAARQLQGGDADLVVARVREVLAQVRRGGRRCAPVVGGGAAAHVQTAQSCVGDPPANQISRRPCCDHNPALPDVGSCRMAV